MALFRWQLTFFVALLGWVTQAQGQNVDCQEILNSLMSGMGGPGNYAAGSAEDLANIYNTYCHGGQQAAPQVQQPLCPAGTSYCANANLCCGSGQYCSHYGCTPIGAVECGSYYCNPGQQCTRDGRCMPAGNTECGDHSCNPGSYCGSRNQCMSEGTKDCGNGATCPEGKKCSYDGKHCLDEDTVDCRSYYCNAGNKCGSNNSCLALTDVDCGSGNFCPEGYLCRHGGGCVTREDLAAEHAAELERQRAAAEQRKEELEQKKAAEAARIQAANDAARAKEEERQRVIAQQKADAEAKKAEEARLQEEARAAALKKIEDDKAAAAAKAEENRRIAAQQKADAEAEQKRLQEEEAARRVAEKQAQEEQAALELRLKQQEAAQRKEDDEAAAWLKKEKATLETQAQTKKVAGQTPQAISTTTFDQKWCPSAAIMQYGAFSAAEIANQRRVCAQQNLATMPAITGNCARVEVMIGCGCYSGQQIAQESSLLACTGLGAPVQQGSAPPSPNGATAATIANAPPSQPLIAETSEPRLPIKAAAPLQGDFRTYDNFDLLKGDMQRLENVDLKVCVATCEAKHDCRAYSYDKWNSWCFLKNEVSPLMLDPSSTTGIRAALGAPVVSDRPLQFNERMEIRLLGKSYRTVPASSFGACESECKQEEKCLGATFANNDRVCQLFESILTIERGRGVSSVVKKQATP